MTKLKVGKVLIDEINEEKLINKKLKSDLEKLKSGKNLTKKEFDPSSIKPSVLKSLPL